MSYSNKKKEQVDYITSVYECVARKGLTVYYDKIFDDELWGLDLVDHFEDIFKNRAKYCMMFISEDYVEGFWPKVERQAALSRQITEKRYILPVRFDKTPVPGLSPTIKYQEAEKVTPSELADKFEKIIFEDALEF